MGCHKVKRSYFELRVNAFGGGSEEAMRDLAARQYELQKSFFYL